MSTAPADPAAGSAETTTVLVADDDRDILDLLCLRLERAGYRVLRAVDGEAAIDLIRKEIPDVCILDVRMPKLDGYEVVTEIRADPRTRHIPVMIATAHADPSEEGTSKRFGADDYVAKPFNARELVSRIPSLLAARR